MSIENIVNSKAYSLFDFFYKLFMLNILWILFTLSGFVILSIVPATITVYLILKDTLSGKEVPIFKSFFKIFFSRLYMKSLGLTIILLLFFGVIGSSYYLVSTLEALSNVKQIGIMIVSIINYIGIMTTLHILPVFIYFPYLSVVKSVKYGFLLSFSLPFQTLLMLATAILSLVLGYALPFYFFLFGVTAVIALNLYIIRKKYSNLKAHGNPLSVEQFIK